jgi:hypothetical protein
MRSTKTALTAIAALLLLTVFTVTPAFAQRGRHRPDDLNGLLGGKTMFGGGWTGGESYNLNSFTDGSMIHASQHSGFEVFGNYRFAENLALGLAIQNAQNNIFNPQLGQNQARMDETNIRVVAALNTRWFKINNRPTPYPWWQGVISYGFDISGKTISVHDGSLPRSGFNDIGTVHKDIFSVAVRCGIGSAKIGIAYLQLEYDRAIIRTSAHLPDTDITNDDQNGLALKIGINM